MTAVLAPSLVVTVSAGPPMNQHANKVDFSAASKQPETIDPVFNGVVQEVHQCPSCGNVEFRQATS